MTTSLRLRGALAAALLAASLTGLSAAPALAQTAATATAQPSAAHVALARDVIVASGVSRTFDSMVAQSLEQYKASVLQSQPGLRNELDATIRDVRAGAGATEVSNMLISAAILLTRRMSEAELKDVLAFFQSPSGRKYVETQPQFLDDLVPAIDGWAAQALPGLVDQVRAAMTKKGYKL